MGKFLIDHLADTVLGGFVVFLLSWISFKSPRFKALLKPGEVEKTLAADKDALRKECDTLRTENEKLKNGNEYLLDELAIARTVRSTQRDKLDSSLAETERLTAQIDALKRTLTRDI